MSKKPGVSLERHRLYGRELKQIREILSAMSMEIGNTHARDPGKKPGRAIRALDKAVREIDQARGTLEDVMFAKFPELGSNEGIAVYYHVNPDWVNPINKKRYGDIGGEYDLI